MPNIIHVEHLRKTFKAKVHRSGIGGALRNLVAPTSREILAVDDISFDIAAGELVGYLGPNGAGKSTTIKVLTGLLVPSSGDVVVDGMIPWKDRTAYVANIGAVFGQRTSLWWDLPVIDSLELLQPMYRIPEERFKHNLAEFRELLEMDEFLQTPVRSISLGQRMRAELAAALMHEPKLVLLDEPTIGLDVVAKERIREFIRHINHQRGTTVILTTHDLSDVERLCERVLILDHGHLLYDGRLADLMNRFEDHRLLVVTFARPYEEVSVPGLTLKKREGSQAVYAYDHHKLSPAELIGLLNAHFEIADLEMRRAEIEDTVRRIYEEKLLLN